MYIYYQTIPVEAVETQVDGHEYGRATLEPRHQSDGKVHIQQSKKPRLLRVTKKIAGVAYLQLARVGDAIAYVTDLPDGVVTEWVARESIEAYHG